MAMWRWRISFPTTYDEQKDAHTDTIVQPGDLVCVSGPDDPGHVHVINRFVKNVVAFHIRTRKKISLGLYGRREGRRDYTTEGRIFRGVAHRWRSQNRQ